MVPTLRTLAVVVLLAGIGLSLAVTRSDPRLAHACGSAGPFDFDTFEAENYTTTYSRAIELATAGKAITSAYSLVRADETVDVRYQGLLKGPRNGRSTIPDTTASIPPTIY